MLHNLFFFIQCVLVVPIVPIIPVVTAVTAVEKKPSDHTPELTKDFPVCKP